MAEEAGGDPYTESTFAVHLGNWAALWHPSKNRNVKPEDVSVRALHEVYLWDGPLSRIWRETPMAWLKRHGMPDVVEPFERTVAEARVRDAHPDFNDLATLRPDLAAEWHPHRNGKLTPADVTPGSNKAAWWRAGCGHVFELKVCVRAKAKALSCPYCSGRKVPERPIPGLR